jgi:hypothetical protein
MTKYTNESSAGRARAASYGRGPEMMPSGGGADTKPAQAQRVDSSVRLGDLKGEIGGNVPMSVQMAKPAAYQAKKGTP